jgi:hypothetical protein
MLVIAAREKESKVKEQITGNISCQISKVASVCGEGRLLIAFLQFWVRLVWLNTSIWYSSDLAKRMLSLPTPRRPPQPTQPCSSLTTAAPVHSIAPPRGTLAGRPSPSRIQSRPHAGGTLAYRRRRGPSRTGDHPSGETPQRLELRRRRPAADVRAPHPPHPRLDARGTRGRPTNSRC